MSIEGKDYAKLSFLSRRDTPVVIIAKNYGPNDHQDEVLRLFRQKTETTTPGVWE